MIHYLHSKLTVYQKNRLHFFPKFNTSYNHSKWCFQNLKLKFLHETAYHFEDFMVGFVFVFFRGKFGCWGCSSSFRCVFQINYAAVFGWLFLVWLVHRSQSYTTAEKVIDIIIYNE